MTHLLPLLAALRRDSDPHLLCLGDGQLAEAARHRGLAVAVLPMAHAWDPRVLFPLRRVLSSGPFGFARLARLGGGDTASPEDVCKARAGQGTGGDKGLAHVGRVRWDVVHTHGMRANLPTRLAFRALGPKPCLFATVHSDMLRDYSFPQLARVYSATDRLTAKWADGVIAVSEALRDLLLERGYPSARLIAIHSGMELDASLAERAARDPLSQDRVPGGSGRPPRILTVARLVAVKDIRLALEVTSLLRRVVPTVELVLVGDGPERDRLWELSRNLGLERAVRFAGYVQDIRPFLAEADVYLATSVFEGGVSMAVLEAMAAGLPVVTTAAGGVSEAVSNGETGFVVARSYDRNVVAAELADRVELLLRNHELRAGMAEAGVRRVHELFSIGRTAEATLRAYRRCLAAHGGSS
jgi:glycosyltransferase involved in cell wall biosynthesis